MLRYRGRRAFVVHFFEFLLCQVVRLFWIISRDDANEVALGIQNIVTHKFSLEAAQAPVNTLLEGHELFMG